MSEFIHLHNHTHYSILDAITTPAELVQAALDDGQSAVALTDHGVLFGLMEFEEKAKEKNIKPIYGMEAYLATGSRFDKSNTTNIKRKNYNHLILLAKDLQGYKNLMKLTSYAHTEGFYYRPRIDKELLEKYKDGLIATSACIGGVISSLLIDGDWEKAKREAQYFKDLFGEDFYIELQNHNLPQDEIVLRDAPRLAYELGIPLVATNDIHFLKKEHAIAHNVYLLIKDVKGQDAQNVDITDLKYRSDQYYFKTQKEMIELFKDFPDAIENTVKIADKCNVEFNFQISMPQFTVPEKENVQSLDEYLEKLVWNGINRKYPNLTEEIKNRTNYELGVIKRMGFSDYFLIVADLISAARKMGIRVGPGRGSAAGSIVAYSLDITSVDPLESDLLFERFLNPERISMPDIDIDFDDERRDEVIQYCQRKYGINSVTQIITFGRLSSRMVLTDVGRVIGVPLNTIKQITSKIPIQFGKVFKLNESLKLVDLNYLNTTQDEKLKQLIELSLILEDKNRSAGTHAAGIVITPGEASDYIPIFQGSQNNKSATSAISIATQYSMNYLEHSGVIKMDFLGLRTLSIIDRTLDLIKQNHDVELDIDKIRLDDKEVYDLISSGKTLAVFQFESSGMQDYLKKLKPANLEELTAMNALYRPGPMASIPDYIDRKWGTKKIEYLHPLMEPVLKKTYGVIIYQEQVMQLVQHIANFTLGEADLLRRAMSKKDLKKIEKLKPKFIAGAKQNGIEEKLANEIYDLIEKFSNYGFNKSHAYVYSYLAYQTAYLKAHYSAEFLAANMTAEINNQDYLVELMDEAKSLGINVSPPDINTSDGHFTVHGNTIYFGMAGLKGVGVNTVKHIVEVRQEGDFTSFFDFVKRVDSHLVNRRVLESLIFSGAFDSIADGKRRALYDVIDDALNYTKSLSKNEGLVELFGESTDGNNHNEPTLPNVTEWSDRERLAHEKEVLNFYVSGHPLNEYESITKSFSDISINKWKDPENRTQTEKIMLCGLISGIRTNRDKKGNQIAFVQVEDFSGKAEAIFWSNSFAKYEGILQEGRPITIYGKVDTTEDDLKIFVDEAYSLPDTITTFAKGYKIWLDTKTANKETIKNIKKIISNSKGKTGKLAFILNNKNEPKHKEFIAFDVPLDFAIETIKKLEKIPGIQSVRLMRD